MSNLDANHKFPREISETQASAKFVHARDRARVAWKAQIQASARWKQAPREWFIFGPRVRTGEKEAEGREREGRVVTHAARGFSCCRKVTAAKKSERCCSRFTGAGVQSAHVVAPLAHWLAAGRQKHLSLTRVKWKWERKTIKTPLPSSRGIFAAHANLCRWSWKRVALVCKPAACVSLWELKINWGVTVSRRLAAAARNFILWFDGVENNFNFVVTLSKLFFAVACICK